MLMEMQQYENALEAYEGGPKKSPNRLNSLYVSRKAAEILCKKEKN
jgi:hypothetical protein